MKNKTFLSILFLIIFGIYHAQSEGFYVTSDADGYTNIRRQPNAKAEIKTRLKSGTLIYSYGDEPNFEDPKGDWHGITYLSEFDNTTDEATVFIHKSKVKRLEKTYPALKKKIINANTIQLIGKDRVVTVLVKKFNPKEHKIKVKNIENGFKEWELIDGKDFLGSDHQPHIETEYASIKIKTGNHEITLPKAAFGGLYNPNRMEAYEDIPGKRLFIVAYNGEGGGAYEVCWEIDNGKYVKRLVVRGF